MEVGSAAVGSCKWLPRMTRVSVFPSAGLCEAAVCQLCGHVRVSKEKILTECRAVGEWGRGGEFGLLGRETGKVERMGKKREAGVWGKRWRAQEGARVNQERGRIESAGQWKLPRRKGLKVWDGCGCDRGGRVAGEDGDGTCCACAARSGKRRSEHDKSGCGGGFPLEKTGGVEEDEVGMMTTREKEEEHWPFFPMFLPLGVAAGNGEMVCFDRGCAHVVAVTARTRRVVVLDGGRCWRQAGREIATRSGLQMSGEESMPIR